MNEAESREKQIVENETVVDYDTREYPLEVLVHKFNSGLETGEGEIYIPDYQREFVWNEERQSKLIESLLIGLPIPPIFVADVQENDGRLEIVDGSQRVRTIVRFSSRDLILTNLQKLTEMNGKTIKDLLPSRRRRFDRTTIRMIELTRKADENVRRDIFERINNGSDILKDMERRRGSSDGPVLSLVGELAIDDRFEKLAPISDAGRKRREADELVLRFFAYLDGYQHMPRKISDLVDSYLAASTKDWSEERANVMRETWDSMLAFVGAYFPAGFREQLHHKSTRRNRFDSIAVGVALALSVDSTLIPPSTEWVDGDPYKTLVTSGASNTQANVSARIEFVRDKLLGII